MQRHFPVSGEKRCDADLICGDEGYTMEAIPQTLWTQFQNELGSDGE